MLKRFQPQSGMVLVLAILVGAAVLATAALFGNLIIREIQQSRLIDQSIQAYYLAESGVERALYQSRRREAVKAADCQSIFGGSSECDATDGYCTLSGQQVSCIIEGPASLGLRGNWQVEVTNENETSVNLAVGESFQLDLFSPFETGGFSTNIKSIVIESDLLNTTLSVEITNLTWLVGGTLDCPLDSLIPTRPATSKGRITLTHDVVNNIGTTSFFKDLDFINDPPLDPDCSYSIRIGNVLLPTAVDGQFTIKIFDGVDATANQLAIPSRLIIDSEAVFGKSFQKVRVRTPVRPPLSGLYDFVLFSEEEIVKQTP